MAESNIAVTPGSGESVDTFTLSNSNKRQAVVVGDSSVAGNVAAVQATDPNSNDFGLVVRDVNSSAVVSKLSGSISVYVGGTAGTINVFNVTQGTVAVSAKDGTFAVYFSPAQPTVAVLQGGVALGNSGVVGATTQRMVHATDVGTSVQIMTGANDVGNVVRVKNLIDGTLSTVTAVTSITNALPSGTNDLGNIIRVKNLVDGTLTTVTNVTTLATATRVDRVMNVVDGTISTVTFVPAVQRVQNVVDGTLSLITMTQRVNNVVDGTLSTVVRVTNLIDGSVKIFLQGGQAIGGSGVTGVTTQRVVHAVDVVQSMNIMAIGTTNTLGIYVSGTAGTLITKNDPSSVLAGITSSISTYISGTAGTIRVAQIDGTMAVFFSPSRPAVLADNQHTSSIFTISGSTSGISVSGVNLVAPSSSYNFKVYAYSIQTTGAVSLNVRFVNGSGASQTEFWRPLITASGVTGAQGANLAVAPPAYLFATGTNTSLNILLDSASLVHYSVSYVKESA